MTRRATIRTTHADPETIAAALAPDNTDEMDTRVESIPNDPAGDNATEDADADQRRVVTTIERETTSGLQSTVDDTLVNLAVADRVAAYATDEQPPSTAPGRPQAGSTDANRTTTDTTNTTHE